MKCPVCNKEINRPLHITKMKDDAHKQYVESQKQLAVELLKSGLPLVDIQKDERIIIIAAVTDYLYANHEEEMKEIGRKTRNDRISKSKTTGINVRKEKRKEIEEIIKNGEDNVDFVTCQICNFQSTNISNHVFKIHGMKAKQYKSMYPGFELFSQQLRDLYRENMLANNPNDMPESIKKMKKTKAGTKSERVRKAKEQFANGERKASNNSGRGMAGIRLDLGHNCRSMWEANIARILKLKGINYEFEHKTYPFYDNQGNLIDSYLPDFYLPEYDAFIEVKGQMDDTSLRKIELFEQEGFRVIIVEGILYNWLTKRYKGQLDKRLEISGRNIVTHPELYKEG